jgi:hypothetical protein
VVGNFVQTVIWHVGDDDAGFGGRRVINGIGADAVARNHPAAAKLPNHFGSERFAATDNPERIAAGNCQLRLGGAGNVFQRTAKCFERASVIQQMRQAVADNGDFHGRKSRTSRDSRYDFEDRWPSDRLVHDCNDSAAAQRT